MLPSIAHRAVSHRVGPSSRWSSSRVGTALLAVVALLVLPACVPYVKYEDAVSKLTRANQVNQDLERTLRDAQIGETAAGGDLRAAMARIESLETQNSALTREKEILEQEKLALMDQLRDLRRGSSSPATSSSHPASRRSATRRRR